MCAVRAIAREGVMMSVVSREPCFSCADIVAAERKRIERAVDSVKAAFKQQPDERDRYRAALERIAAGNPATPGKWLSDIEMADIARAALKGDE